MKYKYRLFVPSLVMTSLFASTMLVSANESEHNDYEQQNIFDEDFYEISSTEQENQVQSERPTNQKQTIDSESPDFELEENLSAETEEQPLTEDKEVIPPSESIENKEIHNEDLEKDLDTENTESNSVKESIDQELPSENNSENDETNSGQEELLLDNDSKEIDSENGYSNSVKESIDQESSLENNSERTEPNYNQEKQLLDTDIDEILVENEANFEKKNIETGNDNDQNKNLDELQDKGSIHSDSLETENKKHNNTLTTDSLDKKEENTSVMSKSTQIKDASVPVYSDAQFASKIKNSNNSGFYSSISRGESVSAQNFLNKTLFIDHQADYDGTTYYRVLDGFDGPSQGWMKEKDLNLFYHSNPSNHRKDYYIDSDNNHRYLLDEPWGSSNQRVKQLNQYDHNAIFNAEKSIKLGALTFYYGNIGNDSGWIQDNHLENLKTLLYTSTQYASKIKSSNNSGFYSSISRGESVSAQNFLNKTLFIDHQADYDGTTYYRVLDGFDGPSQGWMKEKDLNLFYHSNPSNHRKDYYIDSDNNHRYLLDEPWGSSNQRVKQLNQYDHNAIFNAEKSIKLGALTFYYGNIGNDSGWIQDNHLENLKTLLYTSTQYASKIKSSNNSGFYSSISRGESVSAQNFLNKTLFIDHQADYDGTTYYRVLDGFHGPSQGWMKEEDLNLFHHTTPIDHSRNYYINSNNRSQYLLDEPWGTSKQRVKKLNQYNYNSSFNAEKSIKLGALTFYYGNIGNDYGWIQDKYLTTNLPSPPSNQIEVNTVRYNQSLNQVLNTQMNLNAKPQAWANGGGWRNATRNEVRHYLDTSHQTSDEWMYTFLNLDRAQGISSSVINQNLLSGKGILSSKGASFVQAAQQHGVNEVYLISHAIHETGHGQSQLARGVMLDGKTYYNMYGIGAVDSNPINGGARYAQQMGWDTPEKAIIGGAQFIARNYFNRGQTTLYSMRWNPLNPGTYQYATDVNWAYATARNLKSYYDTLGIKGQYYTKHIF